MVRPPQEFVEAAREYVPVRITNINRLDLNAFVFDYDLTLAIVLANADGTVYHRYGGRANVSPLSMGTLVEILKDGMETHREYSGAPSPPEPKPPVSIEELVRDRLRGRIQPVFGCYHCHYVREAEQDLALEAGTWSPDRFWIYPNPERIGVVMDQERQNMVAKVLSDSAADRAGIRAGDVLERLDGKRILTKYDIQWVLNERDGAPGRLPFTARRAERPVAGALDLSAEWRVGDPGDYAWRVRNVYTQHMAKFLPTPGFVGEQLPPAELAVRGLSEGQFALRISQLNLGTYLAGVHLGDIIVSAGGKEDFSSVRDFYAWCEALRVARRAIRMRLIRQGAEMNVMVPVSALNFAEVEEAPRAVLGFIVQQLAGTAGLRVGNVTDGCGAQRAGLQVGDRIVAVEGKPVVSRPVVMDLVNNKSPGDLFTIDVTREGKPLQFGFVLAGELGSRSDVARLTEPVSAIGQELTCVITISLPEDKHVYSMHRRGFGVPTQLEFRGRGFELLGAATEPDPIRVQAEDLTPSWILKGPVELRQRIRVTDAQRFQLLLQIYAQVCDDTRCHEFRTVVGCDGTDGSFVEYRGRYQDQPAVPIRTSDSGNPN